jgi:hypothetical protein
MNDHVCPFAIDPKHEHKAGDARVFVFGSNLLGIHGAGAARYALNELGAEWGAGEGLMGTSYALPTCYRPGEPVTLPELAVYVDNFVNFARSHPELQFFVSKVGCGLAGIDEVLVKHVFQQFDVPENCDMPPGWGWDSYEVEFP